MALDKQANLCDLLNRDANPLSFAVQYGSCENDWDVLAVYESTPPRSEIIIGKLDLLAIGIDDLAQMVRLLDPTVTEPLLTGQTIAGEERAFVAASDLLRETKIEWPVVRHLLRRSQVAYENALACLPSALADAPDMARALWSNLSWAVSLREFARYYAPRTGVGNAVISLAELVSVMPKPVKDLWQPIQTSKQADNLRDAEDILHAFDRQILGIVEVCL
jgi:hypothetical protein